ALRVEWTKAMACGTRWLEEVVVLNEEMHQVLESSSTEQARWRAQVFRRPLLDPADRILHEGLNVYTEEHIAREATILELWGGKWRAIRALANPIVAGDIPDDTDKSVHPGTSETLEIDIEDVGDTVEDDDKFNKSLTITCSIIA
ncbi:hypothetical protein FIBSPDRAFT_730366, partial [Athelia psychrophila]